MIWSVTAILPSGTLESQAALTTGSRSQPPPMLVTKGPGAMALTRTPYSASSRATWRTMCITPALAGM